MSKYKQESPVVTYNYTGGVDLRDYFATEAISEMQWSNDDQEHNLECARCCYAVADAMIAAREE